MDYIALFILIGALIPMYFVRHHNHSERSTYLKRVSFYMMLGFAVLGGYWIIGQAMVNPGGLQGVWLVFGWVTPIALLSVAAWRYPNVALLIISVLSLVVVIASISESGNWTRWTNFSNSSSPATTIVIFAISIPTAVYGNFHSARISASGLLLIGLVPWILTSAQLGWASMGSVTATGLFSAPAVVAGVLFWWSSRLEYQPEGAPLAMTA